MRASIGGKPRVLRLAGIGLPLIFAFRFESVPKAYCYKFFPGIRSPHETPMTSGAPFKIGKYDVVDVIGRGGMGVVYRARDPQLGRLVAIKMMTAGIDEDPELVQRFFREARSTASLQHPNIVTVYELGDYSGNPYLAMEYLEGCSLDAILSARQPLNLVEKLGILIEMCQGLGYAHQQQVIHRDIKPGNIMVLPSGAVKLVDFGIAHIVGKKVTLPGQVIGSFNYMSPEQIHSKPLDARTDIFSAGIVLYQLLSNSLPFEAANTAATLFKIVHEPPPPLSNFLSAYPPELEACLLRALAKERDERYPDVEEFAADLRRIRDHVRQEMVGRHLQEASALLERNELAKAKEEVLQILKLDRHHGRGSLLLREIQERVQREQAAEQARRLAEQQEHDRAIRDREARVSEVVRRADAETSLDVRARILKEAINQYPHDARLEPRVNQLRDLSQRISEMAQAATAREQAGEYEVALAKWEALRLAYRHYPEIDLHLERVKKLRDQARGLSRGEAIKKLQDQLAARDYAAASRLLEQAIAENPWDDEMMAMQDKVQAGLRLRSKAQQNLASARAAFAERRWEAGRKGILSACRFGKDDPVVWDPAMKEVIEACNASRQEDPGLAERFFRELSAIGSSLPLPSLVVHAAGSKPDISSADSVKPIPPAQPDQISTDLQPAEAPSAKHNQAAPSAPRWIDKVRRAVSSLSGPEHEKSHLPESQPEAAQRPALAVPQDKRVSTREPDRGKSSVPEPKVSPPPAEHDDRDWQSARVIEFPAAAEARGRGAQGSATDLFVAGAVAPALPEAILAEPTAELQIPAPALESRPAVAPSRLGAPSPHVRETEVPSHPTPPPAANLPEEEIRRIEKQLATHIGPLAKVLVKRALGKATTLDELYSVLAATLSNAADRKAFLAARPDFGGQPAGGQGIVHGEELDPLRSEGANPVLDREIDGESVDRAVRILARYVGPISTVLVKRAAQNTRTVRGLYLALAERVSAAERERFLHDSGFSD